MRNWNPALVCSPQRDKIYKNEHKQTQKIVFFLIGRNICSEWGMK